MNSLASKFYRDNILQGLKQLPEKNQEMFKLMYGRGVSLIGPKRSVEEARVLSIEQVVSELSDGQLDWALTQVQNTPKPPPTFPDDGNTFQSGPDIVVPVAKPSGEKWKTSDPVWPPQR